MDASKIETKIQRGNRIAAKVLGRAYAQYRAFSLGPIISNTNALGVMRARFDPDFKFGAVRPNLYGKPIWAVLADRTLLKVGDYLDGPEGMFFIIAMQGLLPTAAVSCNRVITVSRPVQATPGANFYGGIETTAPVITAWPASVLNGTKGERGDVNLPGDVRMPWVAVLVPALDGVQIRSGDVITDDQPMPMRYTVSAAELTDLGWRITAAQTVA